MKIVAIKDEENEYRAAMVPKIVKKFIDLGFVVEVEKSLGENINISDEEYQRAGASIGD
nr:hypothetical protein [Candidatus Anoxychlamydiales bacterium]